MIALSLCDIPHSTRGKGDAPPGADPGAKFETSALYKAEDAQQMKIVAILKAAVPR